MNKVDYILQTLKRLHQSPIGHNQLACMIALGKAGRPLTTGEVAELTGVKQPSVPLMQTKRYIEKIDSVKIGRYHKNVYKLNAAGENLIRSILE